MEAVNVNSIIGDYYPIFELYQALRDQLMDILTDDDLAYSIGGANPTLGALCREIGEIEHAYSQSFKTFQMDFSYRNTTPGLEGNVNALSAWFVALDHALKDAVAALSEDDVTNRTIDRGGGFELSPRMQLGAYVEALLIFSGKVIVYLRAMGKTPPQQWQDWIG